ncbi:MAG: hypothetical protein MZV70_76570 [Desulfobacterales bacterium]|nr:hypothetical protein [Desulfobacterales bacterium]
MSLIVIIGLPGENKGHVLDTAKLLADLGIDGVKIHLLCVLQGTKLEKMLVITMNSNYYPLKNTLKQSATFLELTPPNVTIHRIRRKWSKRHTHSPKNGWGKKFKILNQIDKELEKRASAPRLEIQRMQAFI